MTYSNDTYNFFVYEFTDATHYNSLRLVRQQSYAIAPETITTDDISAVLGHAQVGREPDVTFPHADRCDRILDLLTLLAANPLTRDDITENYAFNSRQTNYHTDAARYLGLVEKYNDPVTGDITFRLTNDATALMKQRHKLKVLGLVRRILERPVFNQAFRLLRQGTMPSTEEIVRIFQDNHIDISGDTLRRRASTVRGWIAWIWAQIDE